MYKAILVDSNYGSVSKENQNFIKEEYEKKGIYLEFNHFETPKRIIEGCKDADKILATGNPPITREVIENLPNLKVVQRFGVGVNSVDLDAATEHGVLILFMPGFCANELSYHSLALIMSILRNITFDKYVKPESITDYDVELVEFEDLLKESDIISIHVPLTNENKHIFNKDAFKLMKNDSIIINVSRGPIINEEDLIEALENNEIGFAGLDVFESEPLDKNNKLLSMDNVVLTPHSAFYGDVAQKNQIQWSIDLVDQVINKKKLKISI